MNAQSKASRCTCLEDVASLVGIERMRRMRLAEDIDPAGVRSCRFQHGADQQVEIRRPVLRILGRHNVGAEEGGLAAELASYLECPNLIMNSQPIATLDLNSGRAESPQLSDPRGEQAPQLIIGGGAGCRDRHANAASVVRLAHHPRRELGPTVACEDQVAV